MKKIALFISAVFAVSSCVQPEPETAAVSITAHTAPQTRTSMGEGVDGMHDVLWTSGDVIAVSDGKLEGVYVTHEEALQAPYSFQRQRQTLISAQES